MYLLVFNGNIIIKVMAKAERKTKLAFQAVNHCNAESDRDVLTKLIRKLIPLEIIGNCFGRYANDEIYKRELGE